MLAEKGYSWIGQKSIWLHDNIHRCSDTCLICRSSLETLSRLRYANPEDNRIFGLVQGNLRRHLDGSKGHGS